MVLKNFPFTKLDPNDILRPWLPVKVINPHTNNYLKLYGLIDTGADDCALPAPFADILGHNLQAGHMKEVDTGNGRTIVYSHTVRIEIFDFVTQDVLIDFMPNLHVPLLGVKSFLSNFIITINYPELTFSLEEKIHPHKDK